MDVAINSLNKTYIKKHFRLCHRDERQASSFRLVIIENTIPNLLVTTIMPDPQFVDFKKVLRSHIKLGNAYQPRQIARMILQRLYTIREKDLIYPTFSSSPHSISPERKSRFSRYRFFVSETGQLWQRERIISPAEEGTAGIFDRVGRRRIRDRFNND